MRVLRLSVCVRFAATTFLMHSKAITFLSCLDEDVKGAMTEMILKIIEEDPTQHQVGRVLGIFIVEDIKYG